MESARIHVCALLASLAALNGVLTNEVVNFQFVIKKALKLVVLVQWHGRIRFYAP